MTQYNANIPEQIRNLLRSKYSIDSIVKELIQNADDAGATQIHFAWTSNWPPNGHPLLNSPSILVLNNGKFTDADSKWIINLNVGSKRDEIGAIGKYGLGMKSVFHICEAFFYLASENQEVSKGQPFVGVLSPWPKDDGSHDLWHEFTRATNILIDRVKLWNHGCDRWFCLVLPLRTLEQIPETGPLLAEYPTKDDFSKNLSFLDLSRITPLTRKLESISIWNWDENRQTFARDKSLDLKFQQEKRCSFPVNRGNLAPIIGSIIETNPSKNSALCTDIVGIEQFLPDESFIGLKQDSKWPKNQVWIVEKGRYEDVP